MVKVQSNLPLLRQFEAQLDTSQPENSPIATRVLGYGEMSTTLQIGRGDDTLLVYKRMPMFESEAEANHYAEVYWEYVRLLAGVIGVPVVDSDLICVHDEAHDRFVLYLAQTRLPAESIGNQFIRQAALADAESALTALLQTLSKVFKFNQDNAGQLNVGIDGQISNWAIFGDGSSLLAAEQAPQLLFFDTGSPMLQEDGEEKLSPEIYLRSAPSFLAWILRRFFLQDVVARYYDFRLVVIDLLGNLYKESRPDLVLPLAQLANTFFEKEFPLDLRPITVPEVRSYYRQDAWIWRLYLGFRRIDQRLHLLRGRYYPYILPGRTAR